MRLIDADVLNNFIDKWLSKKCDEHGNTTPNEWLDSLKRCVDEQPTAYDIDKVVEQLEELSDERYKAYCIAFNSDDRAEYDAYTNAIEIVKDGGK